VSWFIALASGASSCGIESVAIGCAAWSSAKRCICTSSLCTLADRRRICHQAIANTPAATATSNASMIPIVRHSCASSVSFGSRTSRRQPDARGIATANASPPSSSTSSTRAISTPLVATPSSARPFASASRRACGVAATPSLANTTMPWRSTTTAS
jgi:hypothetical protein